MLLTWISFFIQGLFSSLLIQRFDVPALPFIVVTLTTAALIVDLSKNKVSKVIFMILFFSYCFRLLLLIFDLFGRDIFILPNSGLDSEMYHNSALMGLTTGEFGRGGLYSRTIAVVYSLFGTERILSQFTNILLSINSILLTHKILDIFNLNQKTKNLSIFIMAFIPNYALLSSILLRESILIFSITLSVYNFSKWIYYQKSYQIFSAFLFGLFASVYHSGSIAIILSYAIILIFYDKSKKKYAFTKKSLFYAFILLFVFSVIYFRLGDVFFSQFVGIDNLEDIFQNTENRIDGGSAYSINITSGNPVLDFLINTPIRMIYYLMSPLPWQWRGINDIIAFVFSSLFYGYTLLIAFKELSNRRSSGKNLIILFLIASVLSVVIFSWGVSNSGTALRHRDKFVAVFVILFGLVKNSAFRRRVK